MSSKVLLCKCSFLDGKEIDISVKKDALGADLFDSVCNYLNIKNRNMFGLIHKCGFYDPTYRWWVRMEKPLRKQVSGKCKVWAFALAIKFYPSDNFERYEDITRYHSALQVRDDLLAARITPPANTLAILAAYWAQSENGEYKGDTFDQHIIDGFKFVSAGQEDFEAELEFKEEVIEIHSELKTMTSVEADIKFLTLASSLSMYGCHFYPAIELPNDHNIDHKTKQGRPIKLGKSVKIALGRMGFYVEPRIQSDKHPHKVYLWSHIHSFKYEKNIISVKFHSSNLKSNCLRFWFKSGVFAKIVWRAAIDMHVHYRVETHQVGSHEVALEMTKKYVIFGKKEVKFASSPILDRPTAVIHPSTPSSIRKSHSSLHPAEAEKPLIENVDDKPEVQRESAHLSPALSHRKNISPASEHKKLHNETPKSQRNKAFKAISPETPTQTPKTERKKVLKLDSDETVPKIVEIASAVPRRLRRKELKDTHSESSADEHMSDASDDTDVLCSKNIIEKAFSYHEKGGINSISSWQELCSSRGAASERGRPSRRRSPARRYSSMRRISPDDFCDIDDYRPLIRSKNPICLKANEKRNLSPNLARRYANDQYFLPKYCSDWEYPCSPQNTMSPDRRSLRDHHRDTHLRNHGYMSPSCGDDIHRRAKSMYSLRPSYLDRSPTRDPHCLRYRSPSPVSVCTDIGYTQSRAACKPKELPFASDYTKRVVSESRLAHTGCETTKLAHTGCETTKREMTSEHDPVTECPASPSRYADKYVSAHRCEEDNEVIRHPTRLRHNAIPAIPKFVRSVR